MSEHLSRPDNRILCALSDGDFGRLAPHLKRVRLHEDEVLHEVGGRVERVYFPTKGIISLTLTCAEGVEVELSIVGNEGMVGERAIMGGGTTIVRASVQLAGEAWVMPAALLREEFRRGDTLADLLLCQIEARLVETSQTALCNHRHRIEQRLSRWLLTIADRSHREELHLTHEQIARMLAVRRAGVTGALGTLRKKGFIKSSNGVITLLHRAGLEEQTCECYDVIKDAIRKSLPLK